MCRDIQLFTLTFTPGVNLERTVHLILQLCGHMDPCTHRERHWGSNQSLLLSLYLKKKKVFWGIYLTNRSLTFFFFYLMFSVLNFILIF